MSSQVSRLPAAFLLEPATSSRAEMATSTRGTSNSQTGGTSICRPISRSPRAYGSLQLRVAGGGAWRGSSEKSESEGERLRGSSVAMTTPGGVPPSPPTPHPSGDRPWAFGHRGLLFSKWATQIADDLAVASRLGKIPEPLAPGILAFAFQVQFSSEILAAVGAAFTAVRRDASTVRCGRP
jgi:hypothetical protein